MSVALTILLIAFSGQGLVKFAAGFLVPYRRRINRIETCYRRDGRIIISIYDSVTLAIIVVLVALLFVTDMHGLSFITGLIVGMLLIQIFFHRFTKPLPPEQAPPESPPPPHTLMQYAFQVDPGRGEAGNHPDRPGKVRQPHTHSRVDDAPLPAHIRQV